MLAGRLLILDVTDQISAVFEIEVLQIWTYKLTKSLVCRVATLEALRAQLMRRRHEPVSKLDRWLGGLNGFASLLLAGAVCGSAASTDLCGGDG